MLLLQIVAYNSSRGLRKYKAGYTATLVTCGWSGAVLEPYAQKAHNVKKVKRGPTDQPPNHQPTDQQIDLTGFRVA